MRSRSARDLRSRIAATAAAATRTPPLTDAPMIKARLVPFGPGVIGAAEADGVAVVGVWNGRSRIGWDSAGDWAAGLPVRVVGRYRRKVTSTAEVARARCAVLAAGSEAGTLSDEELARRSVVASRAAR